MGSVRKIYANKEKQKIAPINPHAVTKVYQDLISQVYQKNLLV